MVVCSGSRYADKARSHVMDAHMVPSYDNPDNTLVESSSVMYVARYCKPFEIPLHGKCSSGDCGVCHKQECPSYKFPT